MDPAALQKAQEEARRRAKDEQERRQQEELRRLADQKRAEEERLAEERRHAEEAARAADAAGAEQARIEAERAAQAATATPPPTTQAPAPPATVAGLKPGTLVNLSDPGVIPPVVERAPAPVYPPIALRQHAEGAVELNVLVDEKGTVVDAQVVQGAPGRAGLNEAALDSVKRRRYRPATKDGVPVKVWMSVRVKFELPK